MADVWQTSFHIRTRHKYLHKRNRHRTEIICVGLCEEIPHHSPTRAFTPVNPLFRGFPHRFPHQQHFCQLKKRPSPAPLLNDPPTQNPTPENSFFSIHAVPIPTPTTNPHQTPSILHTIASPCIPPPHAGFPHQLPCRIPHQPLTSRLCPPCGKKPPRSYSSINSHCSTTTFLYSPVLQMLHYAKLSSTLPAVFCHILPSLFFALLPVLLQIRLVNILHFQVPHVRFRVPSAVSLVATYHHCAHSVVLAPATPTPGSP